MVTVCKLAVVVFPHAPSLPIPFTRPLSRSPICNHHHRNRLNPNRWTPPTANDRKRQLCCNCIHHTTHPPALVKSLGIRPFPHLLLLLNIIRIIYSCKRVVVACPTPDIPLAAHTLPGAPPVEHFVAPPIERVLYIVGLFSVWVCSTNKYILLLYYIASHPLPAIS